MLVQFRVENHRSLRDEQTLSMVAANVGDPNDPRLIRRDGFGEALLPAVALYGANASGKSNVLHALGFMREAVLLSHRLWEPERGVPREPFALSRRAKDPSVYEVDIVVDDVRHRYGFVLGAAAIEEEWLHAWPHGRKQTWFEREGEAFEFGKNLHGENETIRGLTRPNSLFLSAAAQNNHAALMPIFAWFNAMQVDRRREPTDSAVAGLRRYFARLKGLRGIERDAVLRLLRAADIGVVDFAVKVYRSGAVTVRLRHKTDDDDRAWLPLESESAGTITMLAMAGHIVEALRRGSPMCIDELEASLHPMLALEVVRLFNDPKHNPKGAQLLFSTHDTNLLGNVLGEPPLRRDQVWFTEKDQSGATKLYPLTDFHPRKEENLERGYLQGRYGAVPFLGDLLPSARAKGNE
jgi:hypothetical protein